MRKAHPKKESVRAPIDLEEKRENQPAQSDPRDAELKAILTNIKRGHLVIETFSKVALSSSEFRGDGLLYLLQFARSACEMIDKIASSDLELARKIARKISSWPINYSLLKSAQQTYKPFFEKIELGVESEYNTKSNWKAVTPGNKWADKFIQLMKAYQSAWNHRKPTLKEKENCLKVNRIINESLNVKISEETSILNFENAQIAKFLNTLFNINLDFTDIVREDVKRASLLPDLTNEPKAIDAWHSFQKETLLRKYPSYGICEHEDWKHVRKAFTDKDSQNYDPKKTQAKIFADIKDGYKQILSRRNK